MTLSAVRPLLVVICASFLFCAVNNVIKAWSKSELSTSTGMLKDKGYTITKIDSLQDETYIIHYR